MLLILIAASVVALILNPLVRLLERRMPRGLAIALIYVAGFGVLAGIGVLLSDPISTQVNRFASDVPHIVDQANHDLANLQTWLNQHGIKVQIQQQGQTALQTLEKHVLKSSGSVVSFSRDLLSQIVTIGFDLVLVLVLSIYLLVYGKQIGELVRRIMPPGDGTPEDDFPLLVQRAVFGYVRGQLLFSLIMGASAAVALCIFGVIGIFPAGEHYARVLRRLLRADGVHPVHRADHRPAAGGPRGAVQRPDQRPVGGPAVRRACSSSRGTSSRPRCSGSRCGSTRS